MERLLNDTMRVTQIIPSEFPKGKINSSKNCWID
jgi:hypothetical protein